MDFIPIFEEVKNTDFASVNPYQLTAAAVVNLSKLINLWQTGDEPDKSEETELVGHTVVYTLVSCALQTKQCLNKPDGHIPAHIDTPRQKLIAAMIFLLRATEAPAYLGKDAYRTWGYTWTAFANFVRIIEMYCDERGIKLESSVNAAWDEMKIEQAVPC